MNVLATDWLDNFQQIEPEPIDFEINKKDNYYEAIPHTDKALEWWLENVWFDYNDPNISLFDSIVVEQPYIKDIVKLMLKDKLRVFIGNDEAERFVKFPTQSILYDEFMK